MSVAGLSPVGWAESASVFKTEPGALSDVELGEGLRVLGRLSSRVGARRAEFIAEADRRGWPAGGGKGRLLPG